MQITHTLTSDFPELKAYFIYFVPEQSLFNYKMDLVLCHAVLYRRVPDSWVCNCHAASKTQTCLSCFPPCEQQGQKYTAMSERKQKVLYVQ